MNSNADMSAVSRVRLTWADDKLASFALLLQQGVLVNARGGISIGKLVSEHLGISRSYLDNRVNTVFLDGRPVDDVDSAIVQSGSELALSASMPGFVGAALRKGGYYAPMRYGITHSHEQRGSDTGEGYVKLKLYNMVCSEMGPALLNSGVYIEADVLAEFFASRSSMFWELCTKVEVDGEHVDAALLSETKWSEKSRLVFLTVVSCS